MNRAVYGALAFGVVLGLYLGLLIGTSFARAMPPGAPEPVTSWQPVRTQPEAPQPSPSAWPVGSAGARPDAESGGVSLPAAPSTEPTASAASTLDPTPVPSLTAAVPGTANRPLTVTGLAVTGTFYCNRDLTRYAWSACRIGYPDRIGVDDLFAAVSADLAYLDGKTFTAWYRGRHVTIRAVDRCDCGSRKLDLYLDAFLHLATLSTGRLSGVEIVR